MKKSSLVMILALVGMVGCSSGKQMKPQKNGMTMRGTEPGQPCVLVGNLVKNCDIDGGVVISKFVECDPLNDFGIKCPAGAKIIGNIGPADGGINVGNDPVYSNNPLSHGNEVVILPDKPAKKPKAKKRYAMGDGDNYREFEVNEQPDKPAGVIPDKSEPIEGSLYAYFQCQNGNKALCPTPDKAAVPAEILTTSDSGLISTTFTLSALPAWSATIGSDNNIEITDPKHELKCYGGTVGNADFSDASTGFTITCVTKSVEKAK